MVETTTNLPRILRLEKLAENLYRGINRTTDEQRLYGGQVIGQGLMAAILGMGVAPAYSAHSLHAYFLRAGTLALPVLYQVRNVRIGRSFCNRQVIARQEDTEILHMYISFHAAEDGPQHQIDMPPAPAPECLPSATELWRQQAAAAGKSDATFYGDDPNIDMRTVDVVNSFAQERKPPVQRSWLRIKTQLPDDPSIHQCALAYLSDWSLMDVSARPHGMSWFDEGVQGVSLDHALWFHRPCQADQWLLFSQDSPQASGARSFNRSLIFDQAGTLVASAAQEALIRLKPT